jgi:transposase
VVASDSFGVSGRAMLAALLAGERDPKVPSAAGPDPVARQLGPLAEAFTGCFTDQHAFLLGKMLARVDAVDADLAELDAKLVELIAPLPGRSTGWMRSPGSARPPRTCSSPRSGRTRARFPTAGHLVSWAKYAPASASPPATQGQRIHRARQPYLARVLGEAAVAASKTNTFLGERYRRIARRRGKQRAIVAVGRSILVIAWHLLSDPEVHFHDLGAGFSDTRIGPERAKRNHLRQLEALGDKVTLEPAA